MQFFINYIYCLKEIIRNNIYIILFPVTVLISDKKLLLLSKVTELLLFIKYKFVFFNLTYILKIDLTLLLIIIQCEII